MRTINKLLKRLTNKKAIITATAVLAIVLPVSVWGAWGPDRPTFDYNKFDASKPCEDPANANSRCGSLDGPVFNSFIHTPSYGDERNFTTTSQGDTADWKETVTAQPGQEVAVRVFVHNNANQDLNGPNLDGKSVATNTRVRVFVPQGVANGFDVAGYVSADNATPGRVYDTATVANANQAFALTYVPGSARIYNNGPFKNGLQISDDVVGPTGTQIGFDALNGKFPGCFPFESVVIIKLKVTAPALQFSKKVTTPGSTNWQSSLTAKRGDTVSWLLDYKNTGTSDLNDITLRDQIPQGLSLVPDSITWIDSNRPNGDVQPDTALSSGGVNVGNYGPQGGGFIRFRTVINTDPSVCKVTNVAFARGQNVPEQSGEATVNIENCQPTQPLFSCDLLTPIAQVDKRTFAFKVDTTAMNGAAVKHYTYKFSDDNTTVMTDKNPTDVIHTFPAQGSFETIVNVTFTVPGQADQTVTSDKCKAVITTSTTPPTPPTTPPVQPAAKVLPMTGPGDALGIFAGTSAISAAAYQLIARFRNRK